MKGIVKAFDGLPWIVKFILALPFIDGIAWGIYRIAKGLDKNDMVMVLVGLIWIFVGTFITWVIDIYTLIVKKDVTFFA